MFFLNTKYVTSKPPPDKKALATLGYRITYDALPHQSLDDLPFQVQKQTKELYNLTRTHPDQIIAPLLELIKKYPTVPVFYNYLRVAYDNTGQWEKSELLLEELYQKHPHYLFAKTNYAFRCLRIGDLETIKEIFQRKFDLNLLYPDRDVFHLSEFTAFTGVMSLYHLIIGDRHTAKKHYYRLKLWAPEHDLTEVIKNELFPTFFQRFLDNLGRALYQIIKYLEKTTQKKFEAIQPAQTLNTNNHSNCSKIF